MRFKELDAVDKQYLKELYYSDFNYEARMKSATDRFEVKERCIRRWWKKLDCNKNGNRGEVAPQLRKANKREIDNDTRIVLVTSAQNQSIANLDMINNMKTYAEFIEKEFNLKVQILIIPSRYRNPTTPVEDEEKRVDMWWDKVSDEFLIYGKYKFGNCLISADSRISPTAENPLRGYESMAAENHLILGHSRLHLSTMPRFKNQKSNVMCTSGYCTMRNYSESKAGDKAYMHHSYGFVVVEKRRNGSVLPPRQVKVKNDGSFCDVRFSVKNQEVSLISKISGYVLGDIHHRELCKKKMRASEELMSTLNPDNIVAHDVYDGSTVNPHEKDNLFTKKLKIKDGLHLIEEEVQESIDFLNELNDTYRAKLNVIQSNHDDFLDRYINKQDWRRDLHNSEAYLKYATIQQKEDLRDFGNIYGYLVESGSDFKIRYVKNTDSLQIESYECGSHGEHGINGARGSTNSFKRLNIKMIIAHQHSPQLKDGVMVVGVSCILWQGYNSKGLSSWGYADGIIHANGKSQLIIFDEEDLKYTLLTNEGKRKEDIKTKG